jgi:hypothetical protein
MSTGGVVIKGLVNHSLEFNPSNPKIDDDSQMFVPPDQVLIDLVDIRLGKVIALLQLDNNRLFNQKINKTSSHNFSLKRKGEMCLLPKPDILIPQCHRKSFLIDRFRVSGPQLIMNTIDTSYNLITEFRKKKVAPFYNSTHAFAVMTSWSDSSPMVLPF